MHGSASATATTAALTARSAVSSERLQTLRGLACLLLVAFHVIGTGPGDGLHVSEHSIYRLFTDVFMHVRMPLFAFLSGFVYAYRPIQPGEGSRFARKKLRRLFVPLVVVGTLFFLAQQFAPSNRWMPWHEMWRIYVFPHGHFWFLQAILVLFAALAVLENFRLLQHPRRFLAVFVIVLAAHFWLPVPEFLSLRRALYLAPFFLLGIAMNRWRDHLNTPRLALVSSVVFAATMGFHFAAALDGEVSERSTYFGTLMSFSAVLTLLFFFPASRWLAWVGGFSFTIYLYHVFFSAGTRIALSRFGVSDLEVQFAIGLIVATVGPIMFELAVRRYDWARACLLGQSEKRRADSTPAAVPDTGGHLGR